MRLLLIVPVLLGACGGEGFVWSPGCDELPDGVDRLARALQAIYQPADDRRVLHARFPACLPASSIERVLLATNRPYPWSRAAQAGPAVGASPFALFELRRSGSGYSATRIALDLDWMSFRTRDCMTSWEECDRRYLRRSWLAPQEIEPALEAARVLLRTSAHEELLPSDGYTSVGLPGLHQQLLIEGSDEALEAAFSRRSLWSEDQTAHLPLDLAVEGLVTALAHARWEAMPLDGEGRELFHAWFSGLGELAHGDDAWPSGDKLLEEAGYHGDLADVPLLKSWSSSAWDEQLAAVEAIARIKRRAGLDYLAEERALLELHAEQREQTQ